MKISLCGRDDCPTPDEFCEWCVRADEREKIAQAIVAMRNRWLDNFDRGAVGTGPANVLFAFDGSARIARNGGRDE